MYSEFSLALKNVKKLVNVPNDNQKMNDSHQSTGAQGVHVSDYTDQEKSRNYSKDKQGSSFIQVHNELSSKEHRKNHFGSIDNTHSSMNEQLIYSGQKEKQIKELARNQGHQGIIDQKGFKIGSMGETVSRAQGHMFERNGSSSYLTTSGKKPLQEPLRKSSEIFTSGLKQRVFELGNRGGVETERTSEKKQFPQHRQASLIKSYSQKSIESLRSKVGMKSLEKQDSTNQLLRQLHEQDRQQKRDYLFQQSGANSDNNLTKYQTSIKNDALQGKMIANASSSQNMAFRIKSGNAHRSGSQRRAALQAHTKLQEEKMASEVVKHIRKQQQSVDPIPKRIQSAYTQGKLHSSGQLGPLVSQVLQQNLKNEPEILEGGFGIGGEIEMIARMGRNAEIRSQQTTQRPETATKTSSFGGLPLLRNQLSIKTTFTKQSSSVRPGSVATSTFDRNIPRKGSVHNNIVNSNKCSTPYSQTARPEPSNNNNFCASEIKGVTSKLLTALYEAKCRDLQLKPMKEQEKRFIEFCQKTICDRKIIMRECGLGQSSAEVIGQILTGDYFSHLDLGKNNLGNLGLEKLMKGIRQNVSLIHLDIGSNDITYEGALKMFKVLETHKTLSSLVMANHDRLHRNRMGFKACEGLRDLLQKNKVLSMINISDNGISNEGLKVISSGSFNKDSNLVSINLSNNDLSGSIAIQCFHEILAQSKNLLELNLSDNKIADQGVEDIAKVFTENQCRLMKLTLSNINATSQSIRKLMFALKSNNYMKHLNLSNNDLSHSSFDQISLLLWNNKKIQQLEMQNCNISAQGCESIAEGLSKNVSLQYLDISNNKFKPNSFKRWSEVLGKTGLRYLDLSGNNLSDEGALNIVKGLQVLFDGQQQANMQKLIMKSVNMQDAGGCAISQYMIGNTQIKKVLLDGNTINHKYINEINAHCQRNKLIQKTKTVPQYQQELGQLIQITKEQTKIQHQSIQEMPYQLQKKRHAAIRKMSTLHIEKNQKVKEIYEGEDIIQDLRDQEEEMYNEFNLIKENNELMLQEMEEQLIKLEKKEKNKEAYIQEQYENIDKRMEYVKLKNKRVQHQIDHEKGKMDKEQDKYKDLLKELEQQLEDAQKDLRMAQVLQKTYVDQLEREAKKLSEDITKEEQNNGQPKNLLYDEQEVILRNNEGKVCNKKKVQKSKNRKKSKTQKNKVPKDKNAAVCLSNRKSDAVGIVPDSVASTNRKSIVSSANGPKI